MSVSRHDGVFVCFGLFDECAFEFSNGSDCFFRDLPHVKAHIEGDLVVARAGGMQFAARLTNFLGPPTEPAVTVTDIPTDAATPLPTETATPTVAPVETSALLPAIADSYIDSANPDSAAGGAGTTLNVGASPVWTAYLKFDRTSLAGKAISSVTLKVKTTADAASGSADSLNVKLVDDVLWKERYLSFNNSVPVSATLLGTVPANTLPDTWVEITLDPAALQQNAGGLLSLAIEATGSDELLLSSGTLPRKFEATEADAAGAASESAPARIVVASGASFMTDQFFSAGNQALTLNVMDWLVREDALLAVRSRGLRAAPLRQVSESARRSVKYANVLGLPALCWASGSCAGAGANPGARACPSDPIGASRGTSR